MTMKELALNIVWFMVAILCATISINAVLNSVEMRAKKKQRDLRVKRFEEWLNILEEKDINKK